MPKSDAWPGIRELRATPPGLATRKDRRRVLTAALQQAEELFESAAAVGYASRPLPLFYGLSQGGRAIAAAHQIDASKWRLTGHGIKPASGLDVTFEALSVVDNGVGAFTTVAKTLDSPSLPVPTRVQQIVATLPEGRVGKWSSSGELGPLRLHYEAQSGATMLVLTSSVLAWADGVPLQLGSDFANEDERRQWAMDLLSAYPSLGDAALARGGLSSRRTSAGYAIELEWPLPQSSGDESVRHRHFLEHVMYYRGYEMAFPALPGNSSSMHPLVAWWAVLWALSMLARYQPDRWADLLDVDQSAAAVPLESLLGSALDAVPELLLDALASR